MTDYNYAEFKLINEYAGFILKNDKSIITRLDLIIRSNLLDVTMNN